MQIGWIDFSKEERNKVLNVLDLLSEDGTLDELGIAPVRDGFANIFFPGTSTIQTRAKYFLIVPYALADLGRSNESKPQVILERLDAIEHSCGEILLKTSEDGVIGKRSIASNHWVKRAPSEIYWAGIRKYGIFIGPTMSMPEYVRASCAMKDQKAMIKKLGNRRDNAEENDCDDLDSGGLFSTQFWKLPDYSCNKWQENLNIELTGSEAKFLKNQIVENCEDSMMAFILKNDRTDITELNGFDQIADNLVSIFPEAMQQDYHHAKAFSDFLYGARIRYNVILSVGQNDSANKAWSIYESDMNNHAELDIQEIFFRLKINNPLLKSFLLGIQTDMKTGNIESLDQRIIKRECQLKGPSRAKLMNAGEFDITKWIGGGHLDYRFGSAVTIINDIFKMEGVKNAEADI